MADKKTTRVVKSTKKSKVAVNSLSSEKTIDQLRTELVAKQTDMVVAKRGHKLGELTNPRILTVTRKEIARLHTAIRAAEITGTKESK